MSDMIRFIENYYASHLRLSESLPLKTPLSIMIDPVNICNFKCSFCPTGDEKLLESVNRSKAIMDFDFFCKVIGDISNFENKIRSLLIYKDGEPFLNKNIGKMIAYAKEKNIANIIQVVSNGSLIDENRAIEIIEAGLDIIKISVEHVSDIGYRKITKTFSSYETVRKNVEFLYNEKEKRKSKLKIHAKILDTNLSSIEKEKFIKDFQGISDSINIDSLMGWSNSGKKDFTMGISSGFGMDNASKLKKDRKVCPEPFKTMAVNSNGLVSVCCVDWSLGTVVGDVSKESLVDIWNGKKLKEFACLHLKGERRKIEACANCQYMQGLHDINDIDDIAENIIKFYE